MDLQKVKELSDTCLVIPTLVTGLTQEQMVKVNTPTKKANLMLENGKTTNSMVQGQRPGLMGQSIEVIMTKELNMALEYIGGLTIQLMLVPGMMEK